jgi:hypothetical protein
LIFFWDSIQIYQFGSNRWICTESPDSVIYLWGHNHFCKWVSPDQITWLFKCFTKMHGINPFDGSSLLTECLVSTHLIFNSTDSAS